jgi:urea ABC transporter ATP-binding protein UrtD
VLELKEVTKRFGGLVAVDEVSLTVPTGELHCIIGPNGAGKTTLLGLLTGDQRPTAGEIWLDQVRTDGLRLHQIARLGVLRKFQVPGIFADLSVRENLAIAAHGQSALRRLLRVRNEHEDLIRRTLDLVHLSDHATVPAGALAHGSVQWLEIGMVLINEPRVLLLDEPTAGMTRAETLGTATLLRKIAEDSSATIIVVEHDMEFVRRVGHRITVLHKGAVLAQGVIDEIENDPEVRQVYLGADEMGADGAA